ncbi:hypothetical protein P154DRAFT_409143, partial [Amniculicola lignicola CBS 123094]
KEKRKYVKKPKVDENGQPLPPTSKKRAREDHGEEASRSTKRKTKPTAKASALLRGDDDLEDEVLQTPAPAAASSRQQQPQQNLRRTGSVGLKLSLKGKSAPKQELTRVPTMVRIKGVTGRAPDRPPGVGYDSEADEAEDDPAIESQFILRMQPGEDCDRVRKAIEDRKIGVSTANDGFKVEFRMFDKEARRATVTVGNNIYAATMVDLPNVIESMKSWNKKDWVKTADVCQMLVVLGRVKNEDEAKKFPLPREIDPSTHQYPHGLTPPMHWVRKRRFRKRISYRRIEQIEEEVVALMEADRRATEAGGSVEYTIVDADQHDPEDTSDDDDGEDAEGEEDDDDQMIGIEYPEGETPVMEADEQEAVAQALLEGLMDEDEEADDLFGDSGTHGIEGATPATSHDVAMHVLTHAAMPTIETAASTPGAQETSADDDDDDDDGDDEGDSEDENQEDAEALAKREEQEELNDEIRELEQEVEAARQQVTATNNVLFQRKAKAKLDRLITDLELKKGAL